MKNAYVKQVGGEHYDAKYQHWDWVAETGLPYLEASATKYISRWRKKGGRQDLEKALSYVQKAILIETARPWRDQCPGGRIRKDPELLARFITDAGLFGTWEARLIAEIDNVMTVGDLMSVAEKIQIHLNAL